MQKPWKSAVSWLSTHGLLNLLSSRAQDYQPRVAPRAMDCTLPHQLLRFPTGCPTCQSYGDNFSFEIFSSHVTIAGDKVT